MIDHRAVPGEIYGRIERTLSARPNELARSRRIIVIRLSRSITARLFLPLSSRTFYLDLGREIACPETAAEPRYRWYRSRSRRSEIEIDATT
jgi:hypothetical protein